MPKDKSIKKVLVIGSGPIIIGQACEFDYSGTQACKALQEENCQVVLINSNPATIMTDPNLANATYVESITPENIKKIIKIERPDAILPTIGGQTALNCIMGLHRRRVLDKFKIKLIGLSVDTIKKSENRFFFKQAIQKIGLRTAKSIYVTNFQTALRAQEEIGFPTVIRCSFTLGGHGGGIAHNIKEFSTICTQAFQVSKSGLLIEQSLYGWKEYELEVMRDNAGNNIVICGIENIDPMGIHTGDSITVAPIQTLTDKELQRMRQAAFKIMQEVGISSGGCNVQFTINPDDGEMLCVEINPRVSRSSALASKATGFPIAKIATKIALGYNLNELQNDLTSGSFPASFEPSIDYVVTKIPFFNFEKFPGIDRKLTTSMKSIGEVMAIGRTFQESLQKAISCLDDKHLGIHPCYKTIENEENLIEQLKQPACERLWLVAEAFRRGFSIDQIHQFTLYDKWFLYQISELISCEEEIKQSSLERLNRKTMYDWKKRGFSDAYIAYLMNINKEKITRKMQRLPVCKVYKRVDTCAAEFPNKSAYMYSTYGQECESNPSSQKKVIIIGSGANRIGQGIEFDYCCVHASQTVKECGYESIMINCNPSTVSTDYDISDRLYLDPISTEHVMSILQLEQPEGIIVQFGGQTPLNIAKDLYEKGTNILGTPFQSLHISEDRSKFNSFIKSIKLNQPESDIFSSQKEAIKVCQRIGYPVVLRPSYIIGGSSISIANNKNELIKCINENQLSKNDIYVEHFLKKGLEVEVDAICDGKEVLICGIIEHFNKVGIHSGDSVASLSPYSISTDIQKQLIEQTKKISLSLGINGIFNIQFAITDQKIYVLEANLRASRTVPLLSKIKGIPFVEIATKCILGLSLTDQKNNLAKHPKREMYGIKTPIFSFNKLSKNNFPLGPQMKSTGEVLSIGKSIEEAIQKAKIYNNQDVLSNMIQRSPNNNQFNLHALQQHKD